MVFEGLEGLEVEADTARDSRQELENAVRLVSRKTLPSADVKRPWRIRRLVYRAVNQTGPERQRILVSDNASGELHC